MEDESLKAVVMLRRGTGAQIGASRLALLRAVAEYGSITAAAKTVGLSYKAAWDAVQALNNLSVQPLITARTGGRNGGAAEVTPAGHALLAASARIDDVLAGYMERIDAVLEGSGLSAADLVRSLSMRTSARNAFAGTVSAVHDGAINAEVILDIGGFELVAVVTRESVEALGLKPDAAAVALIKSSFVLLAAGHDPLPISARNRLPGIITAIHAGAVNDEVTLQLDGGKTVTAVVTSSARAELDLQVGQPAQALIKASHVILAVD